MLPDWSRTYLLTFCIFSQASALAGECTEFLDQSLSRLRTHDYDESVASMNQTNIHSPHSQDRHLSSGPRFQVQSEHDDAPADTTDVSADHSSTILQTFGDRFLQFSPEKFQEMKAQASALRGSRGMRVWNAAWLRCQEARQQLQERMQDEVHQRQPHRSSWCERHYVDVNSTNVQTAPPGGQNLVVQSTPGPQHPQWHGIVCGAVDLERGQPILCNNTNPGACCNITAKPEGHCDDATNR